MIKATIWNILVKLSFNRKTIWELKEEILKPGLNRRYRNLVRAKYYHLLDRSCSWIGHRANIANVPITPHGIFGIFISGDATIGENCVIFQGVTIGSNSLKDSKGHGAPIIGNNCYIGAGAAIIGKVRIGNNCRIGANAVVSSDISDNCVVVMQPSRIIIKKEVMDNRHFSVNNKDEYGYYLNDTFISVRKV